MSNPTLSYNGKRIIPASFVSYNKVYDTTEDGKVIGSKFAITVEGKILADRGSPDSTGTFWILSGYPANEIITQDQALGSILRKQEALRNLFADQGKSFEIQSADGSPVMKCNPRIKAPIDFRRGQSTSWAYTSDYTIQLEADIIYVNGTSLGEDDSDITDYHIERYNQSWAIEATDDIARVFRLTRQLSAKGKRFYDETGTLVQEAWVNARDYILNKVQLGIDLTKMSATGVLNDSNLQAYNYLRSQNINDAGGEFSCTETWLCFDPGSGNIAAIEEFNVNTRISDNNLATVSIDGNIKGLEVRNNTTRALTSERWTNAQLKFAQVEPLLFSRAQTIAGTGLNPVVINKTIGRNQINGIINYNYEFNNRPSNNITNAISENITVGYENKAEIFAAIPVLGRVAGPILQTIGSTTANKKSLSIEAVMKASTYDNYVAAQPNTDTFVNTFIPTATKVYRDRDTESWSPTNGRYQRSVSWTYEV